mgnify:CR=1 FL=1
MRKCSTACSVHEKPVANRRDFVNESTVSRRVARSGSRCLMGGMGGVTFEPASFGESNVIVASSLKRDGDWWNEVEIERVKSFVEVTRQASDPS